MELDSNMIQTLGNLGEFIGGILVIVALIYLAIQTRQNAKVGYWQMYTTSTGHHMQFFTELAKDPDLQRLWNLIRTRSDSVEISKEDKPRCYSLFLAFTIEAESDFFMNKEFGQRSAQERWGENLRWIIESPTATQMWELTKGGRTIEFRRFVDSMIPN